MVTCWPRRERSPLLRHKASWEKKGEGETREQETMTRKGGRGDRPNEKVGHARSPPTCPVWKLHPRGCSDSKHLGPQYKKERALHVWHPVISAISQVFVARPVHTWKSDLNMHKRGNESAPVRLRGGEGTSVCEASTRGLADCEDRAQSCPVPRWAPASLCASAQAWLHPPLSTAQG